ncbi:MAG: HNH endonuclease [Planctomycetes bacterium]|nr:HNH endonuclease [Planctomycetota bacterium]
MPAELGNYLEITRDSAVGQWRAILARSVLPKGQRQGPFLPIETVLCFGLFRVVDPRRYGGSNIEQVPREVQDLAKTFRRPPGSLTNKMLNLSFDRVHGGKVEPEVFLHLSNSQDLFLSLYRTILEAARRVGLDAAAVPDFVGVAATVSLLGQEELGVAEIEIAVDTVRKAVETAKLRQWFGEQETERFVEQRVRLGQHRFASAVLRAYEYRCGFCGFSPAGLGATGMLIASHVKPWARCEERERLDSRNGIAACPMHDRAFDAGLLTVNGGCRIHRAKGLEARLADKVTDQFFGGGVLEEKLLVKQGAEPRRQYLDYHKRYVFDQAG